ncbi:dTDP-4-dehydrorhamnose reductase [Flavobacterium psychrotrophum]|uniref:dTDP-4-dehydrorhamnose reductase n=1 Tax=Flavobacterium psychrotrophum TaxID=2294119 RepID=UPI000E30DE55
MKKVLVTGAGGQLGQALKKAAPAHTGLEFYFASSGEVDITSGESLEAVFSTFKPDYVINAAAYTAVDKAETEPEKAQLINVTGAANLANACLKYGCALLHVSTDFVFDGNSITAYTEEDVPNPTGVYGKTKLEGEQQVAAILPQHYIIRTSWVYSEFANNFKKTMLRLAAERDTINVVNDQRGTPTNANSLAEALIAIINSNKAAYGIYNYSNEGEATWYDFAKKIFEVNNVSINLRPIPTSAFPTPAKRPAYSVLDKTKIKEVFNLVIPKWQTEV